MNEKAAPAGAVFSLPDRRSLKEAFVQYAFYGVYEDIDPQPGKKQREENGAYGCEEAGERIQNLEAGNGIGAHREDEGPPAEHKGKSTVSGMMQADHKGDDHDP